MVKISPRDTKLEIVHVEAGNYFCIPTLENERRAIKVPKQVRGRRSGRHADGANAHPQGSRCGRRVGPLRVRIRVREHGRHRGLNRRGPACNRQDSYH